MSSGSTRHAARTARRPEAERRFSVVGGRRGEGEGEGGGEGAGRRRVGVGGRTLRVKLTCPRLGRRR